MSLQTGERLEIRIETALFAVVQRAFNLLF